MSTKIIVIRHAPTDYNKRRIFMGRKDIPVDEVDIAQVEQVRNIIREEGCSFFYSSPLHRALKTAQVIGGDRYHIEIDNRLMERCLGDWEGVAKDIVQQQYRSAFKNGKMDFYFTPPHGEAYEPLIKRVSSFLLDIYRLDAGIFVVTHNGIFRVIKSLLTGENMSNVFSEFEPYLTPQTFLFSEEIKEKLENNAFYTVDR